ncbi:MAG: PAS domain S-box protein [Desulfamplus sp.]|nr:PAS domain S-box protein [Desulfamplus sp.]
MEEENNILLEQVIQLPNDINSLQKSEILYRGLLTNLGAGIVVHAPDTSFVMCNSKASELLGLNEEQMKGKLAIDPQWKFLNQNNMPLPIEEYPVNQIARNRQVIKDFVLGINKSLTSDVVWVSLNGFPVLDNRGKISEIVISFIDITERKKAEFALRKSEEKYRSMMEYMEDDVLICSSKHIIEYMNPAMLKKVGHNVIGEVCYKAIYGLDEQCTWCLIEKVLNGESIKTEFVSPKDNKIYSVSISPVFHTDNSVSVLSVFRDITKIKKIEDQLQQAQKMEALGTLAGGIAHDFNNILSPIIGYTELLSDDIPKDSPLRESLDEIYASSMRAKDMVRQILTFSRQEESEVRLMKMQHIIKEVLKLIRSTIPTTIDIKQYINNDCGAINADPTQIHQIVMNLTTNAYHAMEKTGGTMTISLKEVDLNLEFNEQDALGQDIQKGIYACLTVSDNGTGIAEDIKDKIFNPFFTTKKKGKGTGLGLSSVYGIVKSSGGAIRLNSEIGKGTEFNIYLPIADSYLKKDDAMQIKKNVQGGNEKILLVDDEIVLTTLHKSILERFGYQVTSRSSSIEALEAFRANPDKFDIVITDMAMPNLSGDKLAVELIKIRPNIPVLLCTGFSTIMSEEKALSMGIKGFLMKPIIISDLDKKIREVLDEKILL